MKTNVTTWNLDAAHSGINFAVRHMVFAKVRGRFTKFAATIEQDGDANDFSRARVTAEIDAASIDTATGDRDTHLRSPDFFDVEKFPKLTFKSTRIERRSDDKFLLTGELTIKGVTKEVTLDVNYDGSGKDPWGNTRSGFSAKGTLNRKDFGLTWNQALETGGVLVGDKIELELEVQVVKSAQPEVPRDDAARVIARAPSR